MTTKRGFTPIEITIAVLIVGLLVVGIVGVYYTALGRQRLNEATEGVVSMFQKARNLTLSSKDLTGGTGKRYGLHFNNYTASSPESPNQVILFVGDSYVQGASTNEVYQLPNGVLLIPGIWDGATAKNELYIDRITGGVSVKQGASFIPIQCVATNCVYLQSKSGGYKIIRFSPTGVVEIP